MKETLEIKDDLRTVPLSEQVKINIYTAYHECLKLHGIISSKNKSKDIGLFTAQLKFLYLQIFVYLKDGIPEMEEVIEENKEMNYNTSIKILRRMSILLHDDLKITKITFEQENKNDDRKLI